MNSSTVQPTWHRIRWLVTYSKIGVQQRVSDDLRAS